MSKDLDGLSPESIERMRNDIVIMRERRESQKKSWRYRPSCLGLKLLLALETKIYTLLTLKGISILSSYKFQLLRTAQLYSNWVKLHRLMSLRAVSCLSVYTHVHYGLWVVQ